MTAGPLFLGLAEILVIHQDQLDQYGGAAEIRDPGLLKSAPGMPGATFGGEFLHPDIMEMTGALLYHLVRNHPFVDGNKRVGAVAALIFLDLNGHDCVAPEEDLADMVIRVAEGRMTKS